jgi:hypothetical protein
MMEQMKNHIDIAIEHLLKASDCWNDLKGDEWNIPNDCWECPQDIDTLINQLINWRVNIND